MNKQIIVIVNGSPVLTVEGAALSELISGEKPCGGHGKCASLGSFS